MRMKHFECQLLMLFAATFFLGCSQDETATPGGSTKTEPPIFFLAATNDALTRGNAIPAGDLPTDVTFRVYATQQRRQGDTPIGDIQNYIPGPAASADANLVSYQQMNIYADNPNINPYYVGVWKTNQEYLWPQDTWFVNFYAIHPATAPAITDIVNSRQLVYDNTSPMPGNYDLMYSKVLNAHREGYGEFVQVLPDFGPNSTVALTFHHLLSRIMFYGKLSQQFVNFGWTVEVGGISICNINAGGTLDLDAATPALIPAATPVHQNYVMPMNPSRPVLNALTVAQDDRGEQIPLTSPTEITTVIPQKPTPWNPSTEKSGTIATGPSTTGCYLSIQMKIKDADGLYQMGSADNYGTVYLPFTTFIYNLKDDLISWQPAKTYSYTLTFGGGYDGAGSSSMQTISISTAIQPWSSTTVGGEATHKRSE